MPIYEYRCKNCGERFEKLVFSGGGEEVFCENCGSKDTEKLLSTFATSAGDSSANITQNSSCACGNSSFT